MTESQRSICDWADTTFGAPVSDASIVTRALVEMAELVTASASGAPTPRVGDEIADVVIVLARLGQSLGVDVFAIAAAAAAEADPDPCQSPIIHAAPAIDSLADALAACDLSDRAWARRSLGDALWHLVDLAARIEIDLFGAIDAKMSVNRSRQWKLDGNGHGSHVEPAPVEGQHHTVLQRMRAELQQRLELKLYLNEEDTRARIAALDAVLGANR